MCLLDSEGLLFLQVRPFGYCSANALNQSSYLASPQFLHLGLCVQHHAAAWMLEAPTMTPAIYIKVYSDDSDTNRLF